jgi:hypothetical protein
MDNLAYIHLVLSSKFPNPQTKPIGNSWNKDGWDEIFDTLDEQKEEEEEE